MTRRITWLGHATVVVDLDGTRIVTDPLLRRRVLLLMRDAAVAPPYEIDGVLLSHLHFDHLDLPSLASLGLEVPVVVPLGGARVLRGFENVVEIEPGGSVEVGSLRIEAVDAIHDGRRLPVGSHVQALGYVIRGSRSIYFAGDTDLFDEMGALTPIDVALLPVSGWGPTLGPGHLDPERAARALALIEPSIAVPIHWGTYALGGVGRSDREPAEAFALAAAEAAPEVDVRILPVSGALDIP
jgi:L-ascorbate metabolism protein UlaG (beta-lactamase superfamily)